MKMVLNNVNKLVSQLEEVELETKPGNVSARVYAQLLAAYLYDNNLCHAKFLWKRIPSSVKEECPELKQIWSVGQRMWQRDWPAVHTALNYEWSENVRHLMEGLRENVRERAMSLVSEAYSSVNLTVLSGMTGQSLEETKQSALERGWSVEDTTVKPCKVDRAQIGPDEITRTEDQLQKLTQFVSFLEN